jgi:hypothetical protein
MNSCIPFAVGQVSESAKRELITVIPDPAKRSCVCARAREENQNGVMIFGL